MPVQLQHSHPSDGLNQCGFPEKHKYHCTMAGVELEQYATGKDRPEKTGATSRLHFFGNAQALLKTILNLDRLGKTGRYLQQLGSFTFLCI